MLAPACNFAIDQLVLGPADIDLGQASLTTAWLGVEGFASFGF